jgi:hypothetical protein
LLRLFFWLGVAGPWSRRGPAISHEVESDDHFTSTDGGWPDSAKKRPGPSPKKKCESFADILKPRLAAMEVEVNVQLRKGRGATPGESYFNSQRVSVTPGLPITFLNRGKPETSAECLCFFKGGASFGETT